MPSFSFAKIAGGLAVTAMVLAGCVVVEEGPHHRPPPRPGGGPTFCTSEYVPVCGERRGDRQTFANACVARADGYRVVHGGQCRADRPGPRPGPDRSPRACTREYAPVCARRGRDMRTFGNACEARAAEYRVIGSGRC